MDEENKKVLIKSKKFFENFWNIISNTIKFKAKLLSSQDKASRFQQS